MTDETKPQASGPGVLFAMALWALALRNIVSPPDANTIEFDLEAVLSISDWVPGIHLYCRAVALEPGDYCRLAFSEVRCAGHDCKTILHHEQSNALTINDVAASGG